MKKRSFLPITTVILMAWTGLGVAQQATGAGIPAQGKVPLTALQTAKAKGFVRVLVQLNVPWQPEGQLSQEQVLAQRQAIEAGQKNLQMELAGTKYKAIVLFHNAPGLELEVGPDALAALDRSALVVKVKRIPR